MEPFVELSSHASARPNMPLRDCQLVFDLARDVVDVKPGT